MLEISLNVTEEEIIKLPNDMELGRYIRKKFWNLYRQNQEKKFVEYDHCLICGQISPYTKETNINHRVGYVEGAGQSCFSPNECDKT